MKLNRLSYIGMAASAAMLVSCAGNEPAFDAPGRAVHMSVDISRDQAGTRATLTETEGDLSIAWEQDDNILVTDATGAKLGVLTLTTGAGTETARFEGTIKTQLSGAADLNLLYLGRKTVDELAALPSPVAVDFSNQEGTLASLSDNDFFSSTVNARIEGSVATTGDVTMERKTAFAHFTLKFPEGVVMDENSTVSISGEGVYNTASVSMSNGVRFSAEGDGTLTVGNGADFYVTILPGEESITPTFRATAGGKAYKATLAPRVWTAGEFVRESHETGVPVLMEVDNDAFTDPYPDEDPRNPLHKFAKYNLTRVDGLTNGFAAEGDNGALYQWGRNYGFIDDNRLYNSSVAVGSDFINYIDAMGSRDKTNDPSITLDYFVYNPNPNSYFMVSGTSTNYYPNNPQYVLWYDSPQFYTTAEDLAQNPTKYFMDGTPVSKWAGYGNGVIGFDVMNNNADYWLSSFGDGGNTWEERAGRCGYDRANPCPDGWRLPSLEDFKEIAPEGQGIDVNATLASKLSNYSELRQTKDGVRYAIRWKYDAAAITIECVVVDESVSKSDITELFWDTNVDKKVVRKFPFTGSIIPLILNCDSYYMANDHWVVRPHHRGFIDYTGIPAYGVSNSFYWILVGPADLNHGGEAFGGYWIAEKNYAFKFEAKEKLTASSGGPNASFRSTSCMFVGSAEPVMGYAIRPVMDKK